jgi:subtilisin-like proprotein convertase family protein
VSKKSKILNILALAVMISMIATTVSAQPVADVGASAPDAAPPKPEQPDKDLHPPFPSPKPPPTDNKYTVSGGTVTMDEPIVPFSFDGSLWDLAAPLTQAALEGASPIEMPAPLERRGVEGYGVYDAADIFDPNIQTWHPQASMPAPILTFDGINNVDNVPEWGHRLVPPDSDGDIGADYYFQTVNVVNRVYFKDGTPASPVFRMSNMWPASDPCGQWDDGDVIGLYDTMADRWVLTQFFIPGPYFECVAVSKTSDPVDGGWWLYTIPTHSTDLWDYPKVGVWPDAYYMTGNMFYGDPPAYSRVMALERSAMLAGQPMRRVVFDVLDGISLLPANMRGEAPPQGSPGYLLEARSPSTLRLYEFAVDWNNLANSTLTSTDLAVTPWGPIGGANVPQLGTDVLLDTLSDRLMQPLHYRRIGDIESLWANHTITGTAGTAVRWYEIRDPGGTPTVHQQGTYAPDDTYRWMASMATDRDGNMAIGYSASSDSIYPGIRYAGRLFTDTLNILAQDEVTMTAGGGFQDAWSASADPRWGDYTAMGVDPVDDCTFWYTNEYYPTTVITPDQSYNWQMSIGAFKFPSCEPLPAVGWITGTVYNSVTSDLVGHVPLAALNGPMTRQYAGSTDAMGYFTLAVLPGTYEVTAGTLMGYPVANSVTGIVVTSSMTTTVDIALDPYPNLVDAGATVNDPMPLANANGYPEPGERNIELLEAIENTGYTTATNVTAELSALTPGVTVLTSTASYPDIAVGDTELNTTPFVFSVDGGMVDCGDALKFRKVVTTDERVFTITFGLDAIIPEVVNIHSYTSLDVPHVFTDGTYSLITITDTFDIYDLDVTVNITHPSAWDLRIPLFSPNNATYLAYYNNYRGDANFFDTIFDDEALLPITGGRGPFTGRFQPYWPLSLHEGASISGTWDLEIWDDITTTVGTLNSWSMEAQELVAPAYCAWPVPDLYVADTDFAEAGGATNNDGYIDPGESSIDLDVVLGNMGTLTATTVSAVVTPETLGVTMVDDASAYPDILVGEMQTNTVAFNFGVDASVPCGVPLDFEIETTTDDGIFTEMFSLNTGRPGTEVDVLLEDDVESGWGVWTTGGDGAATWVITDEDAHSPTHSWTESPGEDYVNNADDWVQSPVYDFSAFDVVTLDFWHKYDLEDDWDFGLVEASTDGGETWTIVVAYTGYGNDVDWINETVDLSGVVGHESNVRIRFHFTSDSNTIGDGWHIDDITISGVARTCAPEVSWDKAVYVDDEMVTDLDEEIAVVPTSTIVIADMVEFAPTSNISFTLTEEWSESLELVSYETLILPGGSSSFPGMTAMLPFTTTLTWSITDLPSDWSYVITKTFGLVTGTLVLPAYITESLWVDNAVVQEEPVVLQFGVGMRNLYLPLIMRTT